MFDGFGDECFWVRALKPRGALKQAGVFDEHISARLTDFPAWVTERVMSERAERAGICIAGPTGRGKTRLAVAILRMDLLRGDDCRFALAGDILSEIRETFRDDAPRSERAVVEELCRIDCLVIDDIGREGGSKNGQASDYSLSVLHRILSKRIGDGKRTIVTTNKKLTELEEHYDAAIASRLHAMELVVLQGEDRRRLA